MKPIRDSGRDRAGKRTAKQGGLLVAMCVLILLSATIVVSGLVTASTALPVGVGTALVSTASLVEYMPLFLILFVVAGAVTLAGWKSFSMNKKVAAAGITALFFVLMIAPLVAGPIGVTPPGPPGAYVPQWEVLIPTTIQGTPRDANTEIMDSNGGDGVDTGSPAGTLCAFGTNAEADRANRNVRVAVTVDDDVATSTATYSAPDACSFDLAFRLTNPQDANGDGTMDSVSLFGRVRSITATVAQDGNETTPHNIMLFDSTFGWYIGWSRDVDAQTTDGAWISACPAGLSDARLPTAPQGQCLDWNNLGSNAGVDEDYIAFAYGTRNYGFYGYTLPPIGFQYTITIDIGTPESFVTYTVLVFLSARA